MKYCALFLMAIILLFTGSGCAAGTGSGQAAFHHNTRETNTWVANPSHTPKYVNPATGGPLFY